MAQTIATVVGDLYGCLQHAQPESRVLDVLCSAVGARHGVIMRAGPSAAAQVATSHHLTPTDLAGLAGISSSDEYQQVLAVARPGAFSRMTAFMSRRQLARSDTYQRALRPLDGGLAAFAVWFDGEEMVASTFCRSLRADPDFDDEATAMLGICLPHVVAVINLAERMQRERARADAAVDALDIVSDGVIVLNAHGVVVHANAAAEAILARGDRLRRFRQGIRASDASDDRRLQQAIIAARSMQGRSKAHGWQDTVTPPARMVLGTRRPGWPLVVTALPAHASIAAGCDARSVMLHLVDSGCAECLPPSTLRSEFGLTAREAALTHQLAQGFTLVEGARALEISEGTARQYLKLVFNKVGVNSQADLLRVIRR